MVDLKFMRDISMALSCMRRRIAILSLLTAWLLATGSHWDFVQVFAWGRMFAGYAKTMSVGEALEQTFDPEKPCALCSAVRKAKEEKDSKALPPEGKLREKIVMVFQPTLMLFASVPESNPWWHHEPEPLSAEKAAPPVPPPRVET